MIIERVNISPEDLDHIQVEFLEPLEDGTLFWTIPAVNDGSEEWTAVQSWLDSGNTIGDEYAYARNKKYIADRKAEYPHLADQLDYIYHNGVDAWKTDIIDPIKAKYPKPS